MRKVVLKLILLALLIFSETLSWAQQPSTSPNTFDGVAAQAEQARRANRTEEAIELYRKALSLRPQWAEGWFNLGTLLYDRDSYDEAAQAFKGATEINPKVGTAWVMLGLCEFKLERYDEALKHIQHGRQLGTSAEPQFRQVMIYHEGLLLIGKGEFRGAQETLGLMSREGVESDELIVALGLSVLNIRFSDLLAGDSTLRELVRRAGRAEHLSAQKKFDEALDEYYALATDFPKAPNVQHAYGRFLLISNQDEKAIEAFKREIENTPNHLLARLLIADTKLRLRDYAGGLPYAEEAVRLRPQLPLAHYLLGSLLLDTGQTARAITELETARTGLPNEPKIHYALGRAYARAGRKAEAEQARAAFARLNKQSEEK
ncbi:MAG: tetratricopeptide repeat protein [Pyrinomonadaceae bacterium]|nr:tetratricopeptide repeat protein [Pyrinomonadaceae bacterium]